MLKAFNSKRKKGFTLIELLVVIAILGILVLLAAPRFLGYTKDAKVTTMQADAKVLSNAALVYNTDNEGNWPVLDPDGDGNINVVEFTVTDEAGGVDDFKVELIDENKIKNQVQTLEGEYSDYGIVTEGDRAGSVYHIGIKGEGSTLTANPGVEDKDGNKHFGVDLVDKDYKNNQNVNFEPEEELVNP